jgi:hypothetical protein
MFGTFRKTFKLTAREEQDSAPGMSLGLAAADEFLGEFAGATFDNGLYRIHNGADLKRWNEIVGDAFPKFARRISCFAYDWLGRHFALDRGRVASGEPLILMLEPGTGSALQIPFTFQSFHNDELVTETDAALAVRFFREWQSANPKPLEHSKCVGYKIPLFLNGADTVANLEISDLEVYWHLSGGLINQS